MAQAFVNGKIQSGKVVVFIKPTCPYCRKTQEILSQLPFREGFLEFVDITATSNTSEIQDYLQQLTGARTVPRVFIGRDCIGGCSDLETLQQNGELLTRLKQIGALQWLQNRPRAAVTRENWMTSKRMMVLPGDGIFEQNQLFFFPSSLPQKVDQLVPHDRAKKIDELLGLPRSSQETMTGSGLGVTHWSTRSFSSAHF